MEVQGGDFRYVEHLFGEHVPVIEGEEIIRGERRDAVRSTRGRPALSGSKTGMPCFSARPLGVRNQISSVGSSLCVKRADTSIAACEQVFQADIADLVVREDDCLHRSSFFTMNLGLLRTSWKILPMYSPMMPRAKIWMPMKKKRMAKSVKRPSDSGPTMSRRMSRKTAKTRPTMAMSTPEDADELDGIEGKTRHQVEIEPQEAEEAVLGDALLSLFMADLDLDDPLRVGGGEGGDEARRLLAEVDGIDHVPAVCPQHAAVVPELGAYEARR